MSEVLIAVVCGCYGMLAAARSKEKSALQCLLFAPVIALGLYLTLALGIISAPKIRVLFPYSIQFWGSMLAGQALIACAFIAAGWILIEGMRLKQREYFLLSVFFVIGVPVIYLKTFHTTYSTLSTVPPEGTFQVQSTEYTCSAASIANLGSLYNIAISERSAAQTMRLNRFGGSIYQIAHTLQSYGLSFTEINTQKIEELVCPAILIVDYGTLRNGHAILVTEKNANGYSVLDPLIGSIEVRDAQWFLKTWQGQGIVNITK